MSQEQTNFIFELIYQKLKAELALAGLNAIIRRIVVKKERKLWWELILKELNTWVAAIIATATAPIAAAQKKSLAEKDNITDKIPLKVMSITFCFAGLSQKEIIKIFIISSSQPISINFAIWEASIKMPYRTITKWVSKIEYVNSVKRQLYIKTSINFFIKYEPTFSTIIQLFLFFSLVKKLWTFMPLWSTFIIVFTSSQ